MPQSRSSWFCGALVGLLLAACGSEAEKPVEPKRSVELTEIPIRERGDRAAIDTSGLSIERLMASSRTSADSSGRPGGGEVAKKPPLVPIPPLDRKKAVSGDGTYVAFRAPDVVDLDGDTNGLLDILVYDRRKGKLTRASVAADGSQPNADCEHHSISANGRFVAFATVASNLVPGDTNGKLDVFVRDLENQKLDRISTGLGGDEPNGSSAYPPISGDGRFVAYSSTASNLVPNDLNGKTDVFLFDRRTRTTTLVSRSVRSDPIE